MLPALITGKPLQLLRSNLDRAAIRDDGGLFFCHDRAAPVPTKNRLCGLDQILANGTSDPRFGHDINDLGLTTFAP